MNLSLNLNRYLRKGQIEKIKILKIWAQKKWPQTLKPMIDYTLGWLNPDIFGTGFLIQTETDSQIVARIPYLKNNQNFQNEIQDGLVVNAGLQIIRQFFTGHLIGYGYQFLKTEIHFKKTTKWASDLVLKMDIDLEYFELKIIEFQKNKKSEFEFNLRVSYLGLKKSDSIYYKIEIQKINLLS